MSSPERDAELAKADAEVARLRAILAAYASAAHHDLNAPLRHIHMFTELIARDHGEGLSHGAADYLDRIRTAVDRSDRLVAALVEYARFASTPATRAPVNLQAIAEDAIAPMVDDIKALGGRVCIETLPQGLGDRDRLVRVFAALADNTLKYRQGEPPIVEIMAVPAPDGFVSIQVADRGPGFPAEQSEAAFELLRRLTGADDVEGAGLGLALCKLLMEMQDGSIRHNPDYGQGAAFILTLPAPV